MSEGEPKLLNEMPKPLVWIADCAIAAFGAFVAGSIWVKSGGGYVYWPGILGAILAAILWHFTFTHHWRRHDDGALFPNSSD